MTYVLQEMLNVRELREQIASDNVMKAKSKLERARKEVVKAEKALENYKIWAKQEETRLYEEVINHSVRRGDISNLRFKIKKLAEDEAQYEAKIEEAKAMVEQRKQELEEAKQAHMNAIKNLQKLEDHKETWMLEYKREQERLQDLEMEEFRSVAPLI